MERGPAKGPPWNQDLQKVFVRQNTFQGYPATKDLPKGLE